MIAEMHNGYGSETYFCAGAIGEHDSCKGDSGGPLMCRKKYSCEWTVVGIVSFGPSPCGTGYGVYTKLSEATEFISNTTGLFVKPKPQPTVKPSCCEYIELAINTFTEPAGRYQRVSNGTENLYLLWFYR